MSRSAHIFDLSLFSPSTQEMDGQARCHPPASLMRTPPSLVHHAARTPPAPHRLMVPRHQRRLWSPPLRQKTPPTTSAQMPLTPSRPKSSQPSSCLRMGHPPEDLTLRLWLRIVALPWLCLPLFLCHCSHHSLRPPIANPRCCGRLRKRPAPIDNCNAPSIASASDRNWQPVVLLCSLSDHQWRLEAH